MPYAYDKPGCNSINSDAMKGSDMTNTQDSISGGTRTLPFIDTLKPAKIETATFALG